MALFRSRDDLRNFLDARNVLVGHGIEAARLDSDMRHLRSRKALPSLIENWTGHLPLISPPYRSDVLVPVRSVRELREVARHLRNCAASYSFDCLAGRSAFLRIQKGGVTVGAVHLERERGEWVISDIVGTANRRPSRPTFELVLSELRVAGFNASAEHGPTEWDKVQKFARLPYNI